MRLDTDTGITKLHNAIQDLIDYGAVFISVTCEQRGMRMCNILQGLWPYIRQMIRCGVRGDQPDEERGYLCTDTSISFWSEKSFATCTLQKLVDPEGGVPAHGFF